MKKRIISLLLALVMLFGVLPVSALAESDDDAQNVAEQSLIGDLKEGWDNLKGTLSDFFDLGNGGQGGGGGFNPGGGGQGGQWNNNQVERTRPVYFAQFYGFTNSNTMISTGTSGSFEIYIGTNASSRRLWKAEDTNVTVGTLADNGITIVPQSGYYVRTVLIACNDKYNCRTAMGNNVAKFGDVSMTSSEYTIPTTSLQPDSVFNNEYVWHDHGSYSFVMVWLDKTPNPLDVIYEAGTINRQSVTLNVNPIVTYVPTADYENKGNANTVAQTGNKITYTANTETFTGGQHQVLDINQKTVTVDSKNYKFTGWKIYYAHENTWRELSSNPVDVAADNIGKADSVLHLNREYKLVAQWEVDTTPPTPEAKRATKEVVFKGETIEGYTIPTTVTLPEKDGTTIKPILIAEGTTSVTLLYRITVTGDAGASFKVTDVGTTLVHPTTDITAVNGVYTGTVGANGTVFYVTKEFSPLPNDKKLSNSITLDGKDDPIPGPDVPYTTPATVKITKVFVFPNGETVTEPSYKVMLDSTEVTPTDHTFTFTGLTAGDYTVSENVGNVAGYTLESAVLKKNGENDAVTDKKIRITSANYGQTLEYTLTNTYTKNEEPLEVSIKKETITDRVADEFKEQLPGHVSYPSNSEHTYVTNADSVTLAYAVTISSSKIGAKVEFEDDATYRFKSGVDVTVAKVEGSNKVTVTFNEVGSVMLFFTKNYQFNGNTIIKAKNTLLNVKVNDETKADVNSDEVTIKKAVSVNFSDLIQKKLYITGDYKFTGETFRAKMRYKAEPGFGTDAWYEFKAAFGKNTKSGAVKDFVIDSGVGDDGYDYIVSFPKAGEYVFYLFEENDGKSGVTYDKSIYKLTVNIKEEANKLVLDEIEYSKWNNGEPSGEADKNGYVTVGEPITFYNTVNTGKKGDHIKIDSPNKLNTDDHFAYIIGYPDGTVQPGGEITRAEVATIFFRLLKDDVRGKYFTKTNDFSDVSRGAWFNNPVSTMATLGIVKGYPDGTFRPNAPITRAEFAAIAARFDESSRYGETRFTDVAGHWAIREIAKAYNNGWIKGYPDNTFRPNRNITRAEAMTLINRVLNRAPETEKDLLNNMNKWSDNMDVDAWYYLAVQEATNSHDYRRKTSSYEHWLRMLEDPNWASYER